MKDMIVYFAVLMLSAVVATMGIAIMFGIEKRVLFWALPSALLCCLGYEITLMLGGSLIVASMVGSALSAAYSDAMAHWLKTPATVLIIPGIVPLVPGGKLYYTMLGAVSSDMEMFSQNGKEALLCAAGLTIGIVAVTAISRPLNRRLAEYRSVRLQKSNVTDARNDNNDI